jgi:hypothetical protein
MQRRALKPLFLVERPQYLPGDVGIIVLLEHDLPCGDLGHVFGLKTALP